MQWHLFVQLCVHLRCFLSGVSVPLSPCKSRVVEAVCILLCQKYFEAKRPSGTGKMNVLKCSISLLM